MLRVLTPVPRAAEYCLELLRQTVMCHADVGTISYTWNEGLKSPFPLLYNNHTCRDFDRIQDWAMQRRVDPSWGRKPPNEAT